MMARMYLSYLLVALMASCRGVVYTPCEFVEAFKKLHENLTDKLPIITCMAGYRNYSTSYRLELPGKHQGYYGIFGLHSSDVSVTGCLDAPTFDVGDLLDDNLEDDVQCMKFIIMGSEVNMEFYEKICSAGMVRNVPCAVTNYVQADVWDPIDKSLIHRALDNGVVTIPTTSTPKPCNYLPVHIMIASVCVISIFVLVWYALKAVQSRAKERNKGVNMIPIEEQVRV